MIRKFPYLDKKTTKKVIKWLKSEEALCKAEAFRYKACHNTDEGTEGPLWGLYLRKHYYSFGIPYGRKVTHDEIIKIQQELSRIQDSLKEKGYIKYPVQFDKETRKVTVQVISLFKPDFIDVSFTIEKENIKD